jgi:hypothetical protein
LRSNRPSFEMPVYIHSSQVASSELYCGQIEVHTYFGVSVTRFHTYERLTPSQLESFRNQS